MARKDGHRWIYLISGFDMNVCRQSNGNGGEIAAYVTSVKDAHAWYMARVQPDSVFVHSYASFVRDMRLLRPVRWSYDSAAYSISPVDHVKSPASVSAATP